MKRDLWQGLQTLTRRKAEMAKADSDEDDGDQFGIQEGLVDDAADPTNDAASSDLDVLPPWGQDDSDYAESSSEVNMPVLLLCLYAMPHVHMQRLTVRLCHLCYDVYMSVLLLFLVQSLVYPCEV